MVQLGFERCKRGGKRGKRRGESVHRAEDFTPTGGMPARLSRLAGLVKSYDLWRRGKSWDGLVVTVSGLAYAISAADDDVCGEGAAGAEVYVRVGGSADKGAVLAVIQEWEVRQWIADFGM